MIQAISPDIGFEAIYRGCVFCKTGKENDVVQRFQSAFPGGRAIAPSRTRIRRKHNAAIEEQVPLLPGYIFFEINNLAPPNAGDEAARPSLSSIEAEITRFSRADSVIKLLRYNDGTWRLHGQDDQFAELLFREAGNIGVSAAYYDEGKRIRILGGFLKDYEGAIIRVNRKNLTAEVNIDLQGKRVSMWLGFELMERTAGADAEQTNERPCSKDV